MVQEMNRLLKMKLKKRKNKSEDLYKAGTRYGTVSLDEFSYSSKS